MSCVIARIIEPRIHAATQNEMQRRTVEIMSVYPQRARHIFPLQRKSPALFAVKDLVLFYVKEQSQIKHPFGDLTGKGPYKVAVERHPRYYLISGAGARACKRVHARRLVKYHAKCCCANGTDYIPSSIEYASIKSFCGVLPQ